LALWNSSDGIGSLLDHTLILYGTCMGGGAAGQLKGKRPPHPKREGNAQAGGLTLVTATTFLDRAER